MKLKTKILSAVIAGIMAVTVFAGVLPKVVHDTGSEMTVSAAASDHTADDAIEWVSAQVGKALNPDGAYGAQCVDLIDAYFEYLGYNWRNYLVNGAKDFSWKSCPEGWSRLQGAQPQKGDVLVYTNGQYGHVAICESANVHYDQNVLNSSTGVYEQWVHKIYTSCKGSGYWGVLRPNFKTVDPIPTGHVMKDSDGAGQTIPNGNYWIYSGVGTNFYLDIKGYDEVAGSSKNVQLYDCSIDKRSMPYDFDAWKVTYLNNNYFKIEQMTSDSALNVPASILTRGWYVESYESFDTKGQEWSIAHKNSGYGFGIQAKCNAYFLDVKDCKAAAGAEIHIWDKNESKAQEWYFVPAYPEATVSDGFYRIHPYEDTSCVLDVSGTASKGYEECSNVQIWDSTGDDIFEITHDKDGYYYITEVVSGKVLDVWNGNNDFRTAGNIQLHTKNTDTYARNQKWAFIPTDEDGYYNIVSQFQGYCMDLCNWKTDNGTNVGTVAYNGTTAQKWTLEPVPPESIKITSNPDKQAYKTGDNIDTTGMKVEAVYTNGKKEDITDEVSLKYDFKKPGYSEVTVVYNAGDTALKAVFIVKVTASGDINNDKKFNVSDAVLLKKHLLGVKKLTIAAPENADMNGDGKVNVIDFIIMKRKLTKK